MDLTCELRAELERVAAGDRRPVVEGAGEPMTVTVPDGVACTLTVVTSQLDETRHTRLERLVAAGLVSRDPLRWYPPSYRLTPAGRAALTGR